jgi:ribose 5-phosphate isomerase B
MTVADARPTRVAVGSDHAGLLLRAESVRLLRGRGLEVVELGPRPGETADYPDSAWDVCAELLAGRAQLGVLVCGTGIGMSMSANKVRGIRAALCHSELEARLARAHNDANVLCLGERVIGAGLAMSVLAAFLDGSFEGGRHQRRVEKIAELHDRGEPGGKAA